MPPTRRFERIARDLEKLPCELHESILTELEFEQLIRLSQSAGPRLFWSLENSSRWAKFFRDGRATEWQKLLAITDQVKALCFKPTQSKGEQPYVFERGNLSFLHNKSWDWTKPPLENCDSLSRRWQLELNGQVIWTSWSAFHQHHSKLVKPWIPYLESTHTIPRLHDGSNPVEVFGKVSSLNRQDVRAARRPLLSITELSNFIDLYQQLRSARSEALARELRRLADLYDAHPTSLKMPFAPQTRRLNEKHVPRQMRCEARNLLKKSKYGWWDLHIKEPYRYRFANSFPALVPYDWCMKLFALVLRVEILAKATYPKAIGEKCKAVLEALPSWVVPVQAKRKVRRKVDPIPDMLMAFDRLGLGSRTIVPQFHLKIWKEKNTDPCCPQSDAELKWLENFVEVIAWMEENFPNVVREVRRGWE